MPIRKFLLSAWEVIEVLAVALASIFIIYGFIAQPFLVQGASMEPNFSDGNYLVVDELTYRFRNPERGEVIVFRNPTNEKEFYIKRVIALPGEIVVITNDTVRINGTLLTEEYIPEDMHFCLHVPCGEVTFRLGEDEYFVMGDNRPKSFDSRSWGPLKKYEIIGTVRLRFWPLNGIRFFGAFENNIDNPAANQKK